MLQSQKLSKNRQIDITTAKAGMIAYDLLSYSLVSEPSFLNLFQILEPRYNVPSRTTFYTSVMPDLYLREKAKVAETIRKDSKEVMSMGVTIDCWTSTSNESYISFLHYLTESFYWKSFVLSKEFMPTSHTAEALLDTLKAITDERSLPNILMFVVSDNAANMSCG